MQGVRPLKTLRLDLIFDLPDDFRGGLVEALKEFTRFVESPETGLDEPPHAASFGVRSPAHNWNRRYGLKVACRSGVFVLPEGGSGWRRFPQDLPARCHIDSDGETWIK